MINNPPKTIFLNINVDEECDFKSLSGVTWSENRIYDTDVEYTKANQWISVKDKLPSAFDNCMFVVDLPHDHRHRKVYGGVYTGDPKSKHPDRRNEFSTPGISFPASDWQLSPTPPK